MAQTKNKIKYNLKNVHVAILTKTDQGGYSYAAPVPFPGAVSLSLDAEGETKPFFADGIVYYRSTTNNGYSGDLEVAYVPDWFRENILQEVKDTNGVLIEKSTGASPVYFALLFEFDGDIKSIRHVLYNCAVSGRPSLESETKEDSIEPVKEKLSISADPREDGLVKARSGDDTTTAAYNSWYQAVYTPVETAGAAKLSSLSIGSLTLTPTFAAGTTSYTTSTGNETDTVTAAGADGATATISVNGSTVTSGSSATWNAGTNTVIISVSKSGLSTTTYTVTVTKAAG